MICAFVHHCHLALAGQGISGHFLQNHEDGGEHGVKGSRQQQHAVRGACARAERKLAYVQRETLPCLEWMDPNSSSTWMKAPV
eukprot:1136123-Pelagomonas_calceolata.AAC.5